MLEIDDIKFITFNVWFEDILELWNEQYLILVKCSLGT